MQGSLSMAGPAVTLLAARLAALVTALAAGTSALAAPDQATKDRCARYAQRAVQQFQLMTSHPQCQVPADLRWQDNVDNHYNGCLMVPEFLRKSEEAARDQHLTACGGLQAVAAPDAAPAAPAPAGTGSAPAMAPVASPGTAAGAAPAAAPGTISAGPAPVGRPVPGAIWVTKASYGANYDPARAANNVYTDIATQCNGKADCLYVVDFHRIGDPFPNVRKNYEVLYTCGTDQRRAYAPGEAGLGSRIELSCTVTAGHITVRKATYGGNIDPARAANNAYADVAGQCNGKADCDYVVDVRRLGDPFVFKMKDYEVLYSCGPDEKRGYAPAEAGLGSHVPLSCANAAPGTPAATAPAPAAKPKAGDKSPQKPAGKP